MAFYQPHATDERKYPGALEAVGLDALVHELPRESPPPIGAGERMLSGGQAQRVALARAFPDPSRTIFALRRTNRAPRRGNRARTQKKLALMEGKLVFFATHRLHWAANMDYIIVMDRGRIAWQGTFGRTERFRRMGPA